MIFINIFILFYIVAHAIDYIYCIVTLYFCCRLTVLLLARVLLGYPTCRGAKFISNIFSD